MARGEEAPEPRRGGLADAFDIPVTARIGPGGGPGRGLRAAVALVVVGLALAVAKPWDWFGPPPAAPGREGAAIPAASPTASSRPVPESRTDLPDRVACLSGQLWLAVVDKVDGLTLARSWTRLDMVPATGPTDPAIALVHAYAEAVPRLGFCAPAGTEGGGATVATPFRVGAWRLDPAGPGVRSATATAIDLRPVAGGMFADHGALYGPPAGPAVGPAAGPGPTSSLDPERVWGFGDESVPRPAGWSPDATPAASAAWSPGTYVFRVDIPGGTDAVWFAIELRGPWTGPAEAREPAPMRANPTATPTGTPTPSAVP